jgi:signal transduction histidine kinase
MSARLALVRFGSLRGRLFAAFVGVILLSLLLTGVTFWLEIRIYDTQQVQTELQAAAPNVFPRLKRQIILFYAQQPQQTLEELRGALTLTARAWGVRVLLTDYCNHIPIDTNSSLPLTTVAVPAACSQRLDDLQGNQPPLTVDLPPSPGQARQTSLLPGGGTSFYLAYSASFLADLQSSVPQTAAGSLRIRGILVARSPSGALQQAFSSIVPELAVAGVFAVWLTLLVVALIVRAVTRPLNSIAVASEKMAGGDYSQRVPETRDDEIGNLARSFNRMASEVSAARDLQRQFIANVSHDLKTPLTSIIGFSQVLTEEAEAGGDPIQRRAAQVINEEARRLQRLTQDLLDLSRLEAGQLQLRRTSLDLNQLAGSAFARYAELPAAPGLAFLDQRTTAELPIWGDSDRLMQVLVNLLDNAVKFSGLPGTVALETARGRNTAILTVANTGPPIAEDDLTRVFQRFYRTDHSRASRTGGTGLGLAIVREIVVAHGGGVVARSENGWVRLVVTLPLATGAPAAPGPGLTGPGSVR